MNFANPSSFSELEASPGPDLLAVLSVGAAAMSASGHPATQVQPATSIAERIDAARSSITELSIASGRPAEAVTLIAVSKKHPPAAIREAWAAGQRHFGENYLNEAASKVAALADLPLIWHYIGRIQSNKTRTIAELFDWVHTIDRRRIAQRLSDARSGAPQQQPLNLCLQVNIDADPNKAGVAANEVAALADFVQPLPGIRLRGLMTILDPARDPDDGFAAMKALFDKLGPDYGWDTLSMGMTNDYGAAIRHGATQVRLGTALFGPRPIESSKTPEQSNP